MVWIACRDAQKTESAISLGSDRERAAAILGAGAMGVYAHETVAETGDTVTVLKRGIGPRLALEWALKTARIQAFGHDEAGEMREIPVQEWTWMTIGFGTGLSRGDNKGASKIWRQVVVPTDKLLQLFPSPTRIVPVAGDSGTVKKAPGPEAKAHGRPGTLLRDMTIALKTRMETEEAFSDRSQARQWLCERYKPSKSYLNQALATVDWTRK
jgi:hypothetical protein